MARSLWLMLVLAGIGSCGDTTPTRELGATCRTNADCASLCLLGVDWPGGFCTHACAPDGCPADSECASTDLGDVCLFLCNDDRDCAFLAAGTASWGCEILPSADGLAAGVCVGR